MVVIMELARLTGGLWGIIGKAFLQLFDDLRLQLHQCHRLWL
jgi:hypothetical protein